MNRRWLALLAISWGSFLLASGPAAAGGHGGGGHAGGIGHAPFAGGFRGCGGCGFRNFGYGGYPGFYGYGAGCGLGCGLGYGLGYGYGYGYPYGYYGGYPGYGYGPPIYVYPAPYSVAVPCPVSGPAVPNVPPPSGQGTPETAPPPLKLTDADVLLNVHVPADATVWVNGLPTTQTGPRREFVSSGLAPGHTYSYEVRARWTAPDGTVVDLKKRVPVQGGERSSLDFAATLLPAMDHPVTRQAGGASQ